MAGDVDDTVAVGFHLGAKIHCDLVAVEEGFGDGESALQTAYDLIQIISGGNGVADMMDIQSGSATG